MSRKKTRSNPTKPFPENRTDEAALIEKERARQEAHAKSLGFSSVQAMTEEWNRFTKFPEYHAKLGELQNTEPNREKRFHQAIDCIHECMAEEEWFAQHTPYPFKVVHWSRIALLASLTCRYLRKLALADSHEAVGEVADIAVEMTETLTALLSSTSEAARRNATLIDELNRRFDGACERVVETNAEVMQRTAKSLPYWPMLRFLNTAANSKKQFTRLAAELKLGEECPINVSEAANYSLETPINSLVWQCLRHFQDVHRHIRRDFEHPGYGHVDRPVETFEEAIEGIVFATVQSPPARRAGVVGMVKREDIPIYKASYTLPKLTKGTAKEWADKAVLPHLCSKYPDFKVVPELADVLKRDGVRTRGQQKREVRKDIIRALTSLARKT